MRIVSLSPSSTEILFALGAGDEVIGVTQYCDYPSNALRRQQLGSWLHVQPSLIEALKPDLIVTTTHIPSELRMYDGHGQLLHLEPTTLAGVLESVLMVGRAVGRTQAAEDVVQAMQRDLEDIRRLAPRQKLLVYCEAFSTPPMHAGYWIPECIEIAGGTPVGGFHANPSTPASVDALRVADPDLMVFHWCGRDEVFDAEHIRNRPGWSELRAVQTNALAFLPENLLNRPGPRLVDGVRQLQAVLTHHQQLQ